MKKVKTISSIGMYYMDEYGADKFIDFEACNRNWLDYRKRKENLIDEMVDYLRQTDNCIGQRDICSSPRFIEFFTRPFTRLEFDESEEGWFTKLKNEIETAGWSTFDLS